MTENQAAAYKPLVLDGDCAKGGAVHDKAYHRNVAGLQHNPWSERCGRRLHVEPFCPEARCSTCEPSDG